MQKSNRNDWHENVYGGERGDKLNKNQYRELLKSFSKRFKYTCQACRKRLTVRSGALSLHHILPREQGGESEPENLILLCGGCHDIVELDWEKYRTYQSILYAFADRPERVTKEKRVDYGVRWQQWVYGGKKNPANE